MADDAQFADLRTLLELGPADAVFLLDANVLMNVQPWRVCPAGLSAPPCLAIAFCTYEEMARKAENRKTNDEQGRRKADAALETMRPALQDGALHRGYIRDDANWILLPKIRLDLDQAAIKYWGEADTALIATAQLLSLQDWMPPVVIVSDDKALRRMALAQRLTVVSTAKAQDDGTLSSVKVKRVGSGGRPSADLTTRSRAQSTIRSPF